MSLTSHDSDTISARIEFEAGTSNTLTLSAPDARVARAMVSDAERELGAIELEISRLLAKRKEKEAHLHRLRVATAPHKQLPTELLADIFAYAHGGAEAILPPSRGTTPWNVRETCVRWRDAVMNDRRLWKRIAFDLQQDDQKLPDLTTLANLVNSVVPPFGSLSISIKVPGHGCIDSIIAPTLSRATEIKIHTRSPFISFLHASSINLPSLERLELHLPQDLYLLNSHMAENFDNAFCLREIHLYWQREGFSLYNENEQQNDCRLLELAGWTGGKDDSCRSSFFENHPEGRLFSASIPWDRLRHVNVLCALLLTTEQASNILKQCMHMTHCALRIIPLFDNESLTAITLPHLRSLTLSTEANITLDLFAAPSLTTLHVGSPLLPIDQVASLISRSHCRLVSFAHEPLEFEAEECYCISLLSMLPDLIELRTPALQLTVTEYGMIGRRELLPILEVLECSGMEALEMDAFTELLERRVDTTLPQDGRPGLREARLYVEDWDFPRLENRWWEPYERFKNVRGDDWARFSIRQWTPGFRD